jgi:protein-S-isoprenylcysteine O-methyltransferase Ste14
MLRYSFFLTLYFLLLVRFEWREATIARYVEPLGHFISIFFPLMIGSLRVAKNTINPMEVLPGWCYKSMRSYTPISFVLITFIFIAMIIIILKVRQNELRMRRYAGGRNSQLELTKETGIQALLYIGVFFLTFFPLGMLKYLYKVSVDEFSTPKNHRLRQHSNMNLSCITVPLQSLLLLVCSLD